MNHSVINTVEAIIGILFILALSRQIELRTERLASLVQVSGAGLADYFDLSRSHSGFLGSENSGTHRQYSAFHLDRIRNGRGWLASHL